MYLPFDVTLTDAKAYTLTLNDTKDKLILSEPMTDVPAATPVLLIGEGATATAAIHQGDAFTSIPNGLLTGSFLSITVNGETDFFLGNIDNAIGFYHCDKTMVSANSAFLMAASISVSGNHGFPIDFSGQTGIHVMKDENTKYNVYDLQGLRRTTPSSSSVSSAFSASSVFPKGIYIVNGRKQVVKLKREELSCWNHIRRVLRSITMSW